MASDLSRRQAPGRRSFRHVGALALAWAAILGPIVGFAVSSTPAQATQSALRFDGRALHMTSLHCDASSCGQTPALWSGLQFCNDDITLQSDSRFGTVYHYRTNSSSNLVGCDGGPIWSPDVAYASLNHLPNYQVLGTVQFYRESIELPTNFTFITPGWESLTQYGFGPYNGAEELGLGQDFGGNHFELQLNGGHVVNCQGPAWWFQGNEFDLGDATALEGHWVDFIVAISFRSDTGGWVDAYERVPDLGQKTFKRLYHLSAKPTYQWGNCGQYTITAHGTDAHGKMVQYMDQQNDYEGYWDKRPIAQFPTHAFLQSGYVIANNLTAVQTLTP